MVRIFIFVTVLMLVGCGTAAKREGTLIDQTYRKRVKKFTLTEAVGPVWISQQWEYNTPDPTSLAK